MSGYVQLTGDDQRGILADTLRQHEARHYGVQVDLELAESRGDIAAVERFTATLAELADVCAFYAAKLGEGT